MALAQHLILALTGILLVVNCGQVTGNIIKDAIDEISDGIDTVTCPAKYTDGYDACTSIFLPFYVTQAAFEEDNLKQECCAKLARIDCTSAIAYIMCGRSGEILGRTVSGLSYFVSARCAQYHSIDKCTNPVGLVFVLAIIGLLVIFMCQCCCCIFCNSCRRKSHRQSYYI